MMTPLSLPFSFDVDEGFAEPKGIARVDEQALTLKFEIRENILGLLRLETMEVRIPIREIDSVTLKKGWFRTNLVVRAYSLNSLSERSKDKRRQFRLRLSDEDRETAQQLVSFLKLKMSGKQPVVLAGMSNSHV